MSVYILHPQTVTTPSYSSSLTKTRNVTKPILPRFCATRPVTVVERQVPSLRTVIPVQCVQRTEKTAVFQQPIEELLGLGTPGEHQVRKRERLNHLTAEEKQNRRKLKNRVAAQTARDRKKYRASKLEEAVRTLILENGKLREENKCLKKTCEELKNQNCQLQNLLNNNEDREELYSETEAGSSSKPSSSLGSAESIYGPQQREQAMMRDEMQQIIGEICEADGTDSALQDVDGTSVEFERFCSEILSEIDDSTATSDGDESKPPKNCYTNRMDCTTPDIIIAPEYLKPDLESQTPTAATPANAIVDAEVQSSPTNSALQRGRNPKCEQLSNYSSSGQPILCNMSRPPSSSPSFLFSDIKEENSDNHSPLISDNDPMLCTPLLCKWDIDDYFCSDF